MRSQAVFWLGDSDDPRAEASCSICSANRRVDGTRLARHGDPLRPHRSPVSRLRPIARAARRCERRRSVVRMSYARASRRVRRWPNTGPSGRGRDPNWSRGDCANGPVRCSSTKDAERITSRSPAYVGGDWLAQAPKPRISATWRLPRKRRFSARSCRDGRDVGVRRTRSCPPSSRPLRIPGRAARARP